MQSKASHDTTLASPSSVKPDNGIAVVPEVAEIKADMDGRFGALTNRFFRRYTVWPQPLDKPGKWRDHRPQHEINQSTLVGDFHHPPENADYRILGMRQKRTVGESIEYEVSRLPKNSVQMRGFVSERIPGDSVDYVLRLCSSEDKEEQQRFVHGHQMFQKIRNKSCSSSIRRHFPSEMGAGVFAKLFYKDIADDLSSRIHCVHFLHRPRPYYIYEKIGPTIDELIRGSAYGFLDISTARHLTVGIIRALRTIHSLEHVHRCVTSSTFSLRTFPSGFIETEDLSNSVVCNDLSFSTIFRSSSKKPRFVERKFYGTLKYSSPNAMKNYLQLPSDDIISAIYIFAELCHGRLSWRSLTDRNEIIEKKENFFEHPTIMVDNTDPEYRIPIDIRDLTLIFKMLKESNPYSGQLNYLYVNEILHRIAEANKQQPGTESFLDFVKINDVEKEFRKYMMDVQNGGKQAPPTTTMTTTVNVTEKPREPTIDGEGGGKTRIVSRELSKKSAENAKKKGSKDKTKKRSKEAAAKKHPKNKGKSAEKHKTSKTKPPPTLILSNESNLKPKSAEPKKDEKKKSAEKSNKSLQLDKTQINDPGDEEILAEKPKKSVE